MKSKIVKILAASLILGGCVAGAPRLTSDQEFRLENISVHKIGSSPSKQYKVLDEISAADCSGAPAGGRVWGNAEKAMETLKRKAAAINADAIVNASCGAAPLLNNCWAAQKCSGQAVLFQ